MVIMSLTRANSKGKRPSTLDKDMVEVALLPLWPWRDFVGWMSRTLLIRESSWLALRRANSSSPEKD